MLNHIINETDDKEFYVGKIRSFENEILNLKDRVDTVNKYNRTKDMVLIEDFIDMGELNMNHHFDTIIKNIVDCVKINSDQEIKILYL